MADVPQIPLATLTQWLSDARAAYNSLMLGVNVVEIMVDGYQAKFGRSDANKLRAYISSLESQIAGCCGRGAVGISF